MRDPRSPIPVMFGIDVEPDALRLDPAAPSGWDGYEAGHRWLSALRSELQDRTGQPVHYCWYLRMDPQVADLYGSTAWLADRYSALIQDSIDHGDEIGLHPHMQRWDRQAGDWLLDLTDHAWREDVLGGALDAYRAALGRPCRTIHLGGAFDSGLLAVADRMGVRFDVSGRPGQYPGKRFEAGGVGRGRLPSFIGMPEAPYRPSRTNLLRPGSGDDALGLTMIPLTVAPLGFPRRVRGVLGRCRYAWKTRFREWAPRVPLAMAGDRSRPDTFGDLLDRAFGPGVGHLAFINRSDSFGVETLARVQSATRRLLDHPRARVVFTTPQELVDRVGDSRNAVVRVSS
jgi:hypothetical protein